MSLGPVIETHGLYFKDPYLNIEELVQRIFCLKFNLFQTFDTGAGFFFPKDVCYCLASISYCRLYLARNVSQANSLAYIVEYFVIAGSEPNCVHMLILHLIFPS